MIKFLVKNFIKVIDIILYVIDKDYRIKEEISCNDERKFTDVIDVDFESDFGRAKKVMRTVPYQVWRLRTQNHELLAADKHRIIMEDGRSLWMQDLKEGDKIQTESGVEKVLEIKDLGFKTHMYDVEIDRSPHHLYTNGIKSHNTTTAGAYLLWNAMMKSDQTILVIANQQSSALEIMQRVRYAYEELPDWLRAGSVTYNKGMLEFDNGSRIVSRATTPTAGRGLSISLLYADEFAFVDRNMQKEFWSAIQPTLSCVTGDTLVLTDNGYRKIEDFCKNQNYEEFFEISDLNVYGKEGIEPVSHGYISKEEDTLIVTTKSGFRLEATKKHPLYALKDKRPYMTPLENISIGDHLRISHNTGNFGKEYIDKDKAYMLGGYIAEGWITESKYQIEISNKDSDFRNVYLNSSWVKPFYEIKSSPHRLMCCSKQLMNEMIEYGISPNKKCYNKEVPYSVFGFNKDGVSNFLSGLFDGDGSVTERGIILSSTSNKLLRDVQLLLLQYDIIANIMEINTESSFQRDIKNKRLLPQEKSPLKQYRKSWNLYIPRSQYSKFKNEIGFRIKRKQKKLDVLSKKYIQDDLKKATVPTHKIISVLEEIFSSTKLSGFRLRKLGLRIDKYKKSKSITVNWLTRLKNILVGYDPDTFKKFRWFFDCYVGNNFWDEVVDISESRNITYDFTVPGSHSFLQNGILGSNTGGRMIVTSTPSSDEDIFATLWRGALDDIDPITDQKMPVGKNGFKAIKILYNEHPDRDPETPEGKKWVQEQKMALGEDTFKREIECQFINQADTLIDSMVLQNLFGKPPIRTEGKVKWYKEIEPNKVYFFALDPSMGVGRDYAAIQVFQLPDLEQVCEYHSDKDSIKKQLQVMYDLQVEFWKKLRNFREQRGDPELYWTVENNALGEAVLELISTTGEDRFPGLMMNEPKRSGLHIRYRKGLQTTHKTKMLACNKLKSLVERDAIRLNSQATVSQLKNFVASGNSFEAAPGYNDDLVDSLLLICRMIILSQNWDDWGEKLQEALEIGEEEIDPMPMSFTGGYM